MHFFKTFPDQGFSLDVARVIDEGRIYCAKRCVSHFAVEIA